MTTFAWAKLWIETLDDFKMGQLPDHLWRRFFEFVLLAKGEDDHGYLPDPRAMAWRLRCSPEEIIADLETLAADDFQMVTRQGESWQVTNFDKRQETPMDAAERKRLQREREARAAYASPACHETVTDRDTEKRREEGEEAEEEAEAECPASRAEVAVTEPETSPIVSTPTIPAKSTIKAVPALAASRFETPDPALKDVWREFLEEIRGQITRDTYDTWYTGLSPGPIENGCVYIGVPTRHTHDWLQFRHQPMIKRTLESLLKQPVDVTFQVIGETPY
jgi:hypothetical protein